MAALRGAAGSSVVHGKDGVSSIMSDFSGDYTNSDIWVWVYHESKVLYWLDCCGVLVELGGGADDLVYARLAVEGVPSEAGKRDHREG